MHMLSPALGRRVFLVKDPQVNLTPLIGKHWNTACFSSDLIILEAPLIDLLTLKRLVVSSGTCSL